MFIYYSSIIICLVAIFLKNKELKSFILIGLMIFLCAGYMCGTDWRSYEYEYNHSSLATVDQDIFEIGYSYLQAICHSVGINFWVYHISLKFLSFFLLCRFVKTFRQNIFLFWFLFIPEMGLALFIDCPFRNLLAAAGFWGAIMLLLNRNTLYYILIVILLGQIHSSAYFLILIYIWTYVHLKSKFYILLFIVFNILAYRLDLIIDYILLPILGIDGYLGDKVRLYFMDDDFWSTSINIGTFYRIVIFVVVLRYRNYIENEFKYGKIVFNLSMLFFLIYPFGVSMKMIQRFLIYTMPFYIISIQFIFRNIRLLSMSCNKKILFMMFVLWGVMKIYMNTSYDYRYIPYTNYFGYMFNPPDFSYRSNYNIKESPYVEN